VSEYLLVAVGDLLEDKPGQFQKFTIDARRIRSVTIEITGVHPPVRGGHRDRSIAGVEFYAKACRLRSRGER